MLCFYEGEDCLDDPGDPDAENSRLNQQLFPEPVPVTNEVPSATKEEKVESTSSEPEPVTPKPEPLVAPQPPNISGRNISSNQSSSGKGSNNPPSRGEIYAATMGFNNKNPITALYEYTSRMKLPPPKFKERSFGVGGVSGGGWEFDVFVGQRKFSCPFAKSRKRDAKNEAAVFVLSQLGMNLNRWQQ